MNTYLVDFGERVNGGRYALFKAKSFHDAALTIENQVGIVDKIAKLEVPFYGGQHFYIEVEKPKEVFAGMKFSDLKWKSVNQIYDKHLKKEK